LNTGEIIKKDLAGRAKWNIFQKSRKGFFSIDKILVFNEKPFERNAQIFCFGHFPNMKQMFS